MVKCIDQTCKLQFCYYIPFDTIFKQYLLISTEKLSSIIFRENKLKVSLIKNMTFQFLLPDSTDLQLLSYNAINDHVRGFLRHVQHSFPEPLLNVSSHIQTHHDNTRLYKDWCAFLFKDRQIMFIHR